jgi:electron transfer flavoprotein alpha/beta subunit
LECFICKSVIIGKGALKKMRIIVLVKQVPDIEKNVRISLDEKSHSINRTGIPSIMNPPDKNALEEALLWKDQFNCEVSVLTMGPTQATEILKEAYTMGADQTYLVSDRVFAGSDTWSTTLILCAAIQQIGSFDYIFAGKQALDGDTGQVGPSVACRLSIPQILNVKKVIKREISKITVLRNFNGFEETIEVKHPALLTFCRHSNVPRFPRLSRLFQVNEINPIILDNSVLKIDPEKVGINGSPTKVFKTFKPVIDKTVKKVVVEKGEEIFTLLSEIISEVK